MPYHAPNVRNCSHAAAGCRADDETEHPGYGHCGGSDGFADDDARANFLGGGPEIVHHPRHGREMPFVRVVRGTLDVAVGSLSRRLVLHLEQDRAEPGHVAVAARLRDFLPRFLAHLRKQHRHGEALQLPPAIIVEPLGNDPRVERIH